MDMLQLQSKYTKKISKKYTDILSPKCVLEIRTLNTALSVIEKVIDIPFEKFSMSLYFYIQSIDMMEFTRAYEAELELAAANPERFISHLHRFYNEQALKIKKDSLYSDFFELYYRAMRIRLDQSHNSIENDVIDAYMNLLIQQSEYLRPDKYKFTEYLVGISSSNQLLTYPDPYYDFDYPSLILQYGHTKSKYTLTFSEVKMVYAKYNYEIDSLFDLEVLTNEVRGYTIMYPIGWTRFKS